MPKVNLSSPTTNLVVLVVFAGINLIISLLVIPRFEMVFQECLPGVRLPGITNFIMAARIPIGLVALVWPIVGFISARRRQPASVWIIHLGQLYFLLMTATAVVAFLEPLFLH